VTEQNAASAPAPKEAGLWAYLRVSLSVAVLLGLLALAAAVIVVPAVAGATPLTVLTSSMEPKLPPGTLVVIKPVEPREVAIGDVITYQLRSGEATVVTHRVISVSQTAGGEYSFITQGDNSAQPDPEPIREVQLRGKLWYSVPYIGWVSNWINGDARSLVVPIIAVGLFGFAGWMVISGMLDKRRKRKVAAGVSRPVAPASSDGEAPRRSGRRRMGTPVDPT
jgi:signal peptidase